MAQKKQPTPRTNISKHPDAQTKSLKFTGPYPRTELAYPKAEPREDKGPNNEYDLSSLYSPLAKYTEEEKLIAVTAYVMTGSVAGVVRLTGLKHQIISDWKNNSSWWPDIYVQIKKQKQEEVDGTLTTIIHAASGELLDRIVNGDEVVTKDGDVIKRKMSGKELGWVLGVTYDKRALLRGDPTSRTEKVDQAALMKELKGEFESMAKEALENSVVKTVTPEGEKK